MIILFGEVFVIQRCILKHIFLRTKKIQKLNEWVDNEWMDGPFEEMTGQMNEK